MISGLDAFTSPRVKIRECNNREEAKNIYHNFMDNVMDDFPNEPGKFGCPVPCNQIYYNFKISYNHENSYLDKVIFGSNMKKNIRKKRHYK